LQTLKDPAQSQWTRGFNLARIKPVDDQKTQWEVSGEIPAYAASGIYQLTSAWSNVAELGKSYDWPPPGRPEISLTVSNDKQDPLRPLEDITLLKEK